MNTIWITAGIIAAAAASGSAVRSAWERRQIKTEYYSVRKERSDGDGEGGSRMRLAFISDVHDYFKFDGYKIVQAVNAANPDLVLLGGDILTLRKESKELPDTENVLKLIDGLSERFTVIYAPGNHEHRFREMYPDACAAFIAELEKRNVLYLENETVTAEDIAISAVDLEMDFYKKFFPCIGCKTEMPEKYLISKLGLSDPKKYHILMMHSPLYLEEAQSWGADLVLSGHFHGGTIRLSEHVGLMTPQFQFFDKHCAGLLTYKNASMIVNRGLGTHTFNIRWNDLPEVSIVDIRS